MAKETYVQRAAMLSTRESTQVETFTVFVTEASGRGTTHVSTHKAGSVEEAKEFAIAATSEEWGGWDKDDLRILGVARGDVEITEWNDLDD